MIRYAAILIGRVLNGKYELVQLLGQGAMGVVYEGRDLRDGTRVAVKMLAQDSTLRAFQLGARFHREATAVMAIDSPHVARVFEHGTDGDTLFLAMECLDGEDLQQLLARACPLPPQVALRIALQACEGLAQAHELGIVHRDVKPANLYLARRGEEITVKVLDFGVAKIRMEEAFSSDASNLTRTGAILGTPLYMSPEQARGARRIDARADVWSMGMVLHQMLSGRLPHRDVEGLGELIMAICTDAPPSLGRSAPWVSEDVVALVNRALRLDPTERFPTAGAMLAELRRLLPEDAPLRLADLVRAEIDPDLLPPTQPVFLGTTLEALGATRTSEVSRKASPGGLATVSLGAPKRSAHAEESVSSAPVSGPMKASTTGPVSAPVSAPMSGTASVPPSARGETPAPPAPLRRRTSVWGILAAAAAGALVVLGALALTGPRLDVGPRPITSAAPTASAVTITDLPPPSHCKPEATAELRAGLKELRAGRWDDAHHRFERAAGLDESCPEAQLRLLLTALGRYPVPRLREVYRRAIDLRDALTERDRLYLDAFEPVVRREPPDSQELTLRLQRLAERFPSDAELVYMASYHTGEASEALELKIALARKAIALDPQYSDAWQMLADALDNAGQSEEAISALDDCLRVAPNSTDCARVRIVLLSRAGRCQETVPAARQLIALAPENAEAYRYFAIALTSTQSPPETVEEALRQGWVRLPASVRRHHEAHDRALVSALQGDFEGVASRVRESLADLGADSDLNMRLGPTLLLLEALLETEQRGEAGAVAADFLKRAVAWSANLTRDSATRTQFSLEPLLLSAGRRAGEVWGSGWREKRDRWLESAERMGMLSEGVRWAFGVALLTETPDEAREALAGVPRSLLESDGKLRSTFAPMASVYIGRTMLLAGRLDDALRFLRDGVASCGAMNEPFTHTRAHLWLGQALEQKGDTAGACAAYAVVRRRWGRASPRSVTAAAAQARASALGCRP